MLNTFFRSPDTLLGRLQLFAIRVFLICPLKAVAPMAVVYWIVQVFPALDASLSWSRRRYRPWPWQVASRLSTVLRLWLAIEVLFYFFYQFKRLQLQRRSCYQPQLQPGKPWELFCRIAKMLTDIQAGGNLGRIGSTHRLRHSPQITPASSAEDLQTFFVHRNDSNVEQLLRQWDFEDHSPSGSVELSAPVSTLLDEAQVLALARAEVSGWFLDPETNERWPVSRLGELQQGNIAEWLAWAFFNSDLSSVLPSRQLELDQLVQGILDLVRMPLQLGYNPNVRSMRLTMDKIISEHRPLAYYPMIEDWLLQGLGYLQRRSGSLTYWYRPPATPQGELHLPFVLCHGIGVSLLQYLTLIKQFLKVRGSDRRALFLVSLPHIFMRVNEDVPSSAQTVSAIVDMLTAWGVSAAHFVGHSFGSVVVSWMVRSAPAMVKTATFIDPVCFLLIKPDVCYNFVYRKPKTPTQLVLSYFGSRDLYIAYSIMRNFFWNQNVLWAEDLRMPALVVLSGKDSIVPSHSVHRYLMAHAQRRRMRGRLRLLWFPDLGHGEFTVGRAGALATQKIVGRMLSMEAAECEAPAREPQEQSRSVESEPFVQRLHEWTRGALEPRVRTQRQSHREVQARMRR